MRLKFSSIFALICLAMIGGSGCESMLDEQGTVLAPINTGSTGADGSGSNSTAGQTGDSTGSTAPDAPTTGEEPSTSAPTGTPAPTASDVPSPVASDGPTPTPTASVAPVASPLPGSLALTIDSPASGDTFSTSETITGECDAGSSVTVQWLGVTATPDCSTGSYSQEISPLDPTQAVSISVVVTENFNGQSASQSVGVNYVPAATPAPTPTPTPTPTPVLSIVQVTCDSAPPKKQPKAKTSCDAGGTVLDIIKVDAVKVGICPPGHFGISGTTIWTAGACKATFDVLIQTMSSD